MQSGRQSVGFILWRGLAFALATLALLDAALVLRIWLLGPVRLDLGRLPFGIQQPNPLLLLPMLLGAWCAVEWRRWRRWLGVPEGSRLNLRGVQPLAWLVMLLSIALLASQSWIFGSEVMLVSQKVRKSARRGPAGMSINGSNRHVSSLMLRVVRRREPRSSVLWINDLDQRGHTAAYYLYPRLLLMEPAQRRWTLRKQMTGVGGHNPLFNVGPRPSLQLSKEFATQRDTDLIVAERRGKLTTLP